MDARRFLSSLMLARRLVGRARVAKALKVSQQTAKAWEIGMFAPSFDRDLGALVAKCEKLVEEGSAAIDEAVDATLERLARHSGQ